MARPLATRSRPKLIALVSFALFAGGCSVSPASPTSGPQVSPTDDPVDLSASPAVSEPGGEVRWSRVAAPFGEPPTATRIDTVVEWQSRLVAFGRVKTPGRNQFSELAAVFLSEIGETWRTVPIDVGVGPEDGSEISLLAAGPRGMVVFGGTCCAAEEQAIWYSPDGGAWERVSLEPSVFDGAQLAAARATDDGFVVVGSQSGRAAIWTSNDGRTWTAVGSAEAGLGTDAVDPVQARDSLRLVARRAGSHDVRFQTAGAVR